MLDTIIAQDKACSMATYARNEVCFTHGDGALLYDTDGREYIDFAAGIGVSSLGYNDPAWVKAVSTQAQTLAHISNLFYNQKAVELAQILVNASGMKKVFMCNSGTEANEGAIKIARKYSSDKYARQDRGTILTFENSFHGRTIAALAATGQDSFHQYFYPFPAGFKFVPAGDVELVKAACTDDVCAILFECVQGEGGVLPLDADFIRQMAAYAKQCDILLICDEVQTGIGRTGSLFCYEQYGISPDIVTAAKGLAGGLPVGAILAGEACQDVLQPGQHGSTFGANPMACAAAQVVLEKINRADFLQEVQAKGNLIRQLLTEDKTLGITEVRGMGLMLGVDIDGVDVKKLIPALLENGVVALSAKTALRLLPPLVISHEQVIKGIEIIKQTVLQLKKGV